jgi:hypothetical protein
MLEEHIISNIFSTFLNIWKSTLEKNNACLAIHINIIMVSHLHFGFFKWIFGQNFFVLTKFINTILKIREIPSD